MAETITDKQQEAQRFLTLCDNLRLCVVAIDFREEKKSSSSTSTACQRMKIGALATTLPLHNPFR